MSVRRFIATAVLFASLTAGAAACSTSAMSSNPIGDPPEHTTSASVSAPVLPGTSAAHPVPFGTPMHYIDTTTGAVKGTITVHAVKDWTDPNPYAQTSGVAADVELSIQPGVKGVGNADPTTFALVDAAHHVFQASFMPGPAPQFPINQALVAGDDVRGWILFETSASAKSLTVQYTLSDGHYFWKS